MLKSRDCIRIPAKTTKIKMTIVTLLLTAAVCILQGCSGSSNPSYTAPTANNPAPGVTLQAITIQPSTPLINIAETRQLTAVGVYSDGSTSDLTSQVKWAASSGSSTGNFVSVSSGGLATGSALGATAITATSGSVVGLIQLTVDTNGFSSNTIAILPVPFKTSVVDAAYLPQSVSKVQGTYQVQEVNLDADQSSSVLPVPSALLASIPMPSGYVPNTTAASLTSSLVAVISYSSPNVLVIDASNIPSDLNSNTVVSTFTAPVTTSVTFNGITCMICAAVVNPLNNKLVLSTAAGYYTMDLTAGSFTALPFSGVLPAPTFSLSPLTSDPFILSSSPGQASTAGAVQILDLTTNAVTTLPSPELTSPSASAIDISTGDGVITDASATADDQTLINVTDFQNPNVLPVPGLGACAAARGLVPMNMAAVGVAPNVDPTNVTPYLFVSQPGGGCFGFEVWPAQGGPLISLDNDGYGFGFMPATPDGNAFVNGSDPNTMASFNSVVNKTNYALLVDANQSWIAKINAGAVLTDEQGSPATLAAGSDISSDLVTSFTGGKTAISVIYLPTPASIVTLSQTNLTFGNQPTGTQSAPVLITLSDVSINPLSISQIVVLGTNASDFAESDTCGAGELGLLGQSKCTITILFTPGAAGARSAQLSITDNGGASPQVVQLSGTGT
jgi:hypothetical protein